MAFSAVAEENWNVTSTAGTSWASAIPNVNGTSFTGGSNILAVLYVGCDNTTTTDTNSNDVTSVTDSQSNTWTKGYEYTNGNGAAKAGVTISIWYAYLVTTLTEDTDTITINFGTSTERVAWICKTFSFGTGNTITKDSTVEVAVADATNNPGSITLTPAHGSAEYLWLRGIGVEDDGTSFTATTDFSRLNANGRLRITGPGDFSTAMGVTGEYRIATATAQTSAPTVGSSGKDMASAFIALYEAAAGGTRRIFFIS